MKEGISADLKRFNHLLNETDRVYHEMALKLGLSDSSMIILYTICERGEYSCLLRNLCTRSGLSKQTINSALRRMEAEGILYLEKAGAKSKNVVLTESGRALAGRTALRVIQAEDEVLASWPREEVEKYLQLTEQYLNAFREKCREL